MPIIFRPTFVSLSSDNCRTKEKQMSDEILLAYKDIVFRDMGNSFGERIY